MLVFHIGLGCCFFIRLCRGGPRVSPELYKVLLFVFLDGNLDLNSDISLFTCSWIFLSSIPAPNGTRNPLLFQICNHLLSNAILRLCLE